jgi:hypothetical protein
MVVVFLTDKDDGYNITVVPTIKKKKLIVNSVSNKYIKVLVNWLLFYHPLAYALQNIWMVES